MTIEQLASFIAVMAAISLAAERLIAILKTIWIWLKKPEEKDREQVAVALLTFGACWATAAFVAGELPQSLWGTLSVGEYHLRTVVVGILGTAGSSFWTSCLGWARAVKEAKKEDALLVRAKRLALENSFAAAARINESLAQQDRKVDDAINTARAAREAAMQARNATQDLRKSLSPHH